MIPKIIYDTFPSSGAPSVVCNSDVLSTLWGCNKTSTLRIFYTWETRQKDALICCCNVH